MEILNLIQGSQEWKDARFNFYTASEAPAMMGASKKVKRNDLLHMKVTGDEREISEYVEKFIFPKGHETEAMARPLIEEDIGEELYPVTGYTEVEGLKMLASYDGLTMMEDIVFEHKQWNTGMAQRIVVGDIDPEHYWQLEHQLMVSESDHTEFVMSDGTREQRVKFLYYSTPERRAELIAGWKQFDKDKDEYVHRDIKEAPKADVKMSLPVLAVNITGQITSSNLAEFNQSALACIASIKTDLQTDQDFADADAMVKLLKAGEKEIDNKKAQALAQTVEIDELFKTMDGLKKEMGKVRLQLDKDVKERKKNIKFEIAAEATKVIHAHIKALESELDGHIIPPVEMPFMEEMKGKRLVSALHDATDTAVAKLKIEIDAIATKMRTNLAEYNAIDEQHQSLFRDIFDIIHVVPETFKLIISNRIQEQVLAEQKRQQEAEEAANRKAAKAVEDAKNSELRAKQEAIDAEDRRVREVAEANAHADRLAKANHKEAQDRIDAYQREAKQLQDAQNEQEEKRKANVDYIALVKSEAARSLLQFLEIATREGGSDEERAGYIIDMIEENKIQHITINY